MIKMEKEEIEIHVIANGKTIVFNELDEALKFISRNWDDKITYCAIRKFYPRNNCIVFSQKS